jgi:hypothetical protein
MPALLDSSEVVSPFVDPVPTGHKRLAAWHQEAAAEPVTIPGLDVAALQAAYGPETGHAPRVFEGTFRIPVGVRMSTYEQLRDAAVKKYIEQMNRRGYDLYGGQRIQVQPGMYPAVDLLSGLPLLDMRECIVRAWFVCRKPGVVRIELPPELLEPTHVGGRSN